MLSKGNAGLRETHILVDKNDGNILQKLGFVEKNTATPFQQCQDTQVRQVLSVEVQTLNQIRHKMVQDCKIKINIKFESFNITSLPVNSLNASSIALTVVSAAGRNRLDQTHNNCRSAAHLFPSCINDLLSLTTK